jgi:hypothetical protein
VGSRVESQLTQPADYRGCPVRPNKGLHPRTDDET